jgi:hypothetical protein
MLQLNEPHVGPRELAPECMVAGSDDRLGKLAFYVLAFGFESISNTI